MRIRELVQQYWWRNAMAKLYSWGASVVMIGALMKLEHFPLSSYFLIAGLGTEAIIFFFSGFEPLYTEWEWDRVYPELTDKTTKSKEKSRSSLQGTALQRFDELLEKAEITPELFAKLGNGMRNLADTSSKMTDISQAHIVTQHYTENVKKAADSLHSFGDAYERSAEELKHSATNLTQSYTKTADNLAHTAATLVEQVNKGSEHLAHSYNKLLEAVNKDYTKLSEKSHSYTEQMEKLNRNLASLNAVYELQLRNEEAHNKASKQLYEGMDTIIDNITASVNDTKIYREEVERLGRKVSALNKVYGSMLTAMNLRDNV